MAWIVYILECADGSYYTGVAVDLDKRIEAHNQGVGARYTRSRRPVALRYFEQAADRSLAQSREHAIKQLNRLGKQALIAAATPAPIKPAC